MLNSAHKFQSKEYFCSLQESSTTFCIRLVNSLQKQDDVIYYRVTSPLNLEWTCVLISKRYWFDPLHYASFFDLRLDVNFGIDPQDFLVDRTEEDWTLYTKNCHKLYETKEEVEITTLACIEFQPALCAVKYLPLFGYMKIIRNELFLCRNGSPIIKKITFDKHGYEFADFFITHFQLNLDEMDSSIWNTYDTNQFI